METNDKIYWGDWDSKESMLSSFEIKEEQLEGYNILFAYYSYENYSASSFVLVEKDNKLYEANGGHCSCHGLEGQWELEETTVSALMARTFSDLEAAPRNALLKILFAREGND